jgi:ABC-type antimicrobial peptide transport system permease subunit
MMNESALLHQAGTIKVSTDSTTSKTKLYGLRLTLARIIWFAAVIGVMIVFFAAIPARHAALKTVVTNANPISLHLQPGDLATLESLGLSLDFYATYITSQHVIVSAVYITLGLIIFWRKSDDWMAVFASLTMIVMGSQLSLYSPAVDLAAMRPEWYVPVRLAIGAAALLFVTFFYIFPNGQFVPRWTRWAAIINAALAFVPAFFPASSWVNIYRWPYPALPVFYMIYYSPGVYAQIYRYRHTTTATQRQQTKWAVWGLVLAFILSIILIVVVTLIFPVITRPGYAAVFALISQTNFTIVMSLFAVSIGFSILRYRLWDIDLVIHRSLIYGGLTVILGVAFLLSLLLVQQVLQVVTGGMQSPIAVALSALLIGGLFQPSRHALRHFVDTRFYHLRADVHQLEITPPRIRNLGVFSGSRFGVYEILESIGHGGMAEVYKACQTTLNRLVAIKILPPYLVNEPGFLARFEREATTVASLRHPHVINVYDFGSMDGTLYIVMEYLEGQNLADYLAMNGPLSLEEARRIIRETADALDYVHGQGLVHRDVKASNIMLQPVTNPNTTGSIYRSVLMDFGIARVTGAGTGLTQTGMIGTLDYMAPEQIVSAKTVDGRADIYALGVIAYQLLTGELPFKSDNPGSTIFAHLQRPAPDARDLVPEVPAHVAQAIKRALEKNPDRRFQSARDFAAALE